MFGTLLTNRPGLNFDSILLSLVCTMRMVFLKPNGLNFSTTVSKSEKVHGLPHKSYTTTTRTHPISVRTFALNQMVNEFCNIIHSRWTGQLRQANNIRKRNISNNYCNNYYYCNYLKTRLNYFYFKFCYTDNSEQYNMD